MHLCCSKQESAQMYHCDFQRKNDLTPVSSVIQLTSGISGTSEPPSLFQAYA